MSAPAIAPTVRRTLRRAATAAARVVPHPDVGTRRLVLCYHSVHPSVHYASANPTEFGAQLDWLAEHCEVVPLAAIGAVNDSGRPRVALTFDDGYADNHEHAFPQLAERSLPATFFVTAGFLERDPVVLSHLSDIWQTPRDDLAPLSWSQVGEMRAAGMTFGSHTYSHANLAALPQPAARDELRRSKEVLETRVGVPVDAIAYPFGKLRHNVDDVTFRLAREAGYRRGYVSLPRAISDRDGALRIPRFGVGGETTASLAAKVRGDIDWHATVHAHLPRSVSAALFRQYP
jgi:peptidoglycan/xylan/chitin deacetylase (PgdA/CDA1 family)